MVECFWEKIITEFQELILFMINLKSYIFVFVCNQEVKKILLERKNTYFFTFINHVENVVTA